MRSSSMSRCRASTASTCSPKCGARSRTLAVVVITGHATPDEVEQVKKLGAVDVIPKPAALTHYHRAIERLHNKKPLNVTE